MRPVGRSARLAAGAKLLRFRIEIFFLLAFGLLVLAPGLTAPPLLDWDEATYAEVAHEAVASGRYLDLSWNGKPYLKKPPLLFWMMAVSFQAFDESEFSARLPSLLMALGTLVLIYLGASAVGGRLAGTFAALIPLGFYFFDARGGRECATDAPLLFFSTLALDALARARHNRRWLAPAGVACGLAVLSKGLAGLIPLIIAGVAVLALPGFTALGLSGLGVILSGAVLVAGPWYGYEALFNYPVFFSSFIGHETLLRVVSHLEENTHSANFSLRILLAESQYLWPLLLPLAALVAGGVRAGVRRSLGRLDGSVWLWGVWFLVAFGAAYGVQTKLPWYVLPALIPVALLGGTMLAAAFKWPGSLGRYSAALAAIATVLLVMEAPARWRLISESAQAQRGRSLTGYSLALRAREMAAARGGGELFFAGAPLPTLVYYSGMRCHFVDTPELKHVELAGAQPAPRQVKFLDLVLLDPGGSASVVGNFDREWQRLASGNGATEELTEADDSEATEAAD